MRTTVCVVVAVFAFAVAAVAAADGQCPAPTKGARMSHCKTHSAGNDAEYLGCLNQCWRHDTVPSGAHNFRNYFKQSIASCGTKCQGKGPATAAGGVTPAGTAPSAKAAGNKGSTANTPASSIPKPTAPKPSKAPKAPKPAGSKPKPKGQVKTVASMAGAQTAKKPKPGKGKGKALIEASAEVESEEESADEADAEDESESESDAAAEWDPTAPIQSLLVTVLRGVDLAQKVLNGQGPKIWAELRCPACQCAILDLYRKGCGEAASATCSAVSDLACGALSSACNAIICPAIDPLFSKECMNILSALQKSGPFEMTTPYNICTDIDMCFSGDENFGLPPPAKS